MISFAEALNPFRVVSSNVLRSSIFRSCKNQDHLCWLMHSAVTAIMLPWASADSADIEPLIVTKKFHSREGLWFIAAKMATMPSIAEMFRMVYETSLDQCDSVHSLNIHDFSSANHLPGFDNALFLDWGVEDIEVWLREVVQLSPNLLSRSDMLSASILRAAGNLMWTRTSNGCLSCVWLLIWPSC